MPIGNYVGYLALGGFFEKIKISGRSSGKYILEVMKANIMATKIIAIKFIS